jgi:hypothetical protein
MRARIEIDPNVRVRGNQTYTGFEDVQGARSVCVGDMVLAWEREDDIVTDAHVVDVDEERRLVYLAVDWHGWRKAGQDAVP